MKIKFFLATLFATAAISISNAQTTLYVPSGTSGIGTSSTSGVGIGVSNTSYNFEIQGQSGAGASTLLLGYFNGTSQNGRLQTVVSSCAGCYNPAAQPGDVIFRKLGDGDQMIFSFGSQTATKSYHFKRGDASGTSTMAIYPGIDPASGQVLINTTDLTKAAGYELAVNGDVIATSIRVKNYTSWPDYVFEKGYNLRPLSEVETFIKENKHLPEVPSETEVKNEGIDLYNMNSALLKKIEELTLYMIEIKKENENTKLQNEELVKRIQLLENKQ